MLSLESGCHFISTNIQKNLEKQFISCHGIHSISLFCHIYKHIMHNHTLYKFCHQHNINYYVHTITTIIMVWSIQHDNQLQHYMTLMKQPTIKVVWNDKRKHTHTHKWWQTKPTKNKTTYDFSNKPATCNFIICQITGNQPTPSLEPVWFLNFM